MARVRRALPRLVSLASVISFKHIAKRSYCTSPGLFSCGAPLSIWFGYRGKHVFEPLVDPWKRAFRHVDAHRRWDRTYLLVRKL